MSDVVGPIELGRSLWRPCIHLVAVLLSLAAMTMCGLPLFVKALATALLGWLAWHEWRCRTVVTAVRFSPDRIEVFFDNGEQHVVEPPFRCLVTRGFLALDVTLDLTPPKSKTQALRSALTRHRWLHVYADQLDPVSLCRLRRVLYLQRG